MSVQKKMFPVQDFARPEWKNLNGAWEFGFRALKDAPGAPFYDRTIEVPYAWGSPLSGVSEEETGAGTGYYRLKTDWDPKGERIFLCFGAVDYTCEVAVNGTVLGFHKGGYSRFTYEVTGLWRRNGENEITVTAEDPDNRGDNTYAKQGYGDARGIWQTVWLEARPAAYISEFTVETKCSGEVTYEIDTVDAETGALITASFADGSVLGSARVGADGHATLSLRVEEPKLWTPETPFLYEGSLCLGGDTVQTYFGVREIGTGVFGKKGIRYITLNGKPYYLNGVLDQSFNLQGYFTLPSDNDCREEILRLKRIGINMARIHIKAEEPLKLYYADKEGLLIMEDIACFWGEPTDAVRAQFEAEMEAEVRRDRNHPSLFYWVIFNETWGLRTHYQDENGKECFGYQQETTAWAIHCLDLVKSLDPTRLVEDNSPNDHDHVKTDVNSFHLYANGYEIVKSVIDQFCDGVYVGSPENYKKGFFMTDVPSLNSECGNYWGVDGNSGESDISWQYKYMMNEFRLHDKLCGFVFTEFHDVVNEFNGYYKLDNSDKEPGYSEYGFSIRDLHAQDYLGADYPPMSTVKPGDGITVPLFGSSFSDRYHGQQLSVEWKLSVTDPLAGPGAAVRAEGSYPLLWEGYGAFPAGEIRLVVPECDGVALLSWTLVSGDGSAIVRNGVLFDIDGGKPGVFSAEPSQLRSEGFLADLPAQEGRKRSGLGSGTFSLEVSCADIPGFETANELRLLFEASTREPMSHDLPSAESADSRIDMNYMLGYRCDPGTNRNSFKQTDEVLYPGEVEIGIDGETVAAVILPDCPADSRGALSHHYQPVWNLLDEAGSYGTLCDIRIPSRVLLRLKDKASFTLSFRAPGKAGLSLFGRRSGRYAAGIVLEAITL